MDLCQLIVVGVVVLCCDASANGRRRGVTRMRARGFPPTGGGNPLPRVTPNGSVGLADPRSLLFLPKNAKRNYEPARMVMGLNQ